MNRNRNRKEEDAIIWCKEVGIVRSFSAESLYALQCPRREWLSNLYPQVISPPENLPLLALGTVVHAVINRALKTREPLRLGKMFLDFDGSWLSASQFCRRKEAAELSGLGRKCINNFFARYGEGGEATAVLESEIRFEAKISTHGNVIRAMNESNPWAYSLNGRIDSLERPRANAFRLRDFKLSYQRSSEPRYRLQFGTYQFCPSLFLGNNEVDYEIFDLSSGAIIPIRPFPKERMHEIVTSTMERLDTDPQGRNQRFCFDCPVNILCESPIPQRSTLQPCLAFT